MSARPPIAAVFALLMASAPALATWSIVCVDTRTGEVAVGSATCITSFNLEFYLPVVRPMIGAGAAQSLVDTSGTNRSTIWNELGKQTAPADILAILASRDPSNQNRQYGIVDTFGRAATFTGTFDGAWAGGLTGQVGTIVYSIQGNVLTGPCVLPPVQQAMISTPGGLPEKLMAAMEAARSMGGDGRCSCQDENPTICGCPPPSFTKAAHVGFMIDARRGDTEGVCDGSHGCANGVYYMNFNITNGSATALDPVLQMRPLFDTFRANLVGVADAVVSEAVISSPSLPNDGVSTTQMLILVRDWQSNPVNDAVPTVTHDPTGSAGIATIGPVASLGNGVYEVMLVAGTRTGTDRFLVTLPRPGGARPLMPSPTLRNINPHADLNGDGHVDLSDLSILLANFGHTGNSPGDVDGNGVVDISDLALLLEAYGV